MNEMNDIAIRAEEISKYYRLGILEEKHGSAVKSLLSFLKSPLKNYRKYRSLYDFSDLDAGASNILRALEDVSFDVRRGERLAIIGANGAGKSTLLKILSRITPPSRGTAVIQGRVSSLLEVGTGFHPELTGRENVYLNGTILGMRKTEIDRKFDEIAEFSGVEKFLDTPVKRYSSGMKVRLAFAVAAHLEPEILIVDEVLAVGDAAFQQKCISKMENVGKDGRTVLFVSHNMGAVTQLCDRAIWLKGGRIRMDGNVHEVVSAYLNDGASGHAVWRPDTPTGERSGIRILEARLSDPTTGEAATMMAYGGSLQLEIRYELSRATKNASVFYALRDSQGDVLYVSRDTDNLGWKGRERVPGTYVSRTLFPAFLKPGRYLVTVGVADGIGKRFDRYEDVLAFDVSSAGCPVNPSRRGLLLPLLDWEVMPEAESKLGKGEALGAMRG